MGYGSLRFFGGFLPYIAEILKKGRKKFSQFLKILIFNFFFIKEHMYMYIYNQNKFKYINILSTSI